MKVGFQVKLCNMLAVLMRSAKLYTWFVSNMSFRFFRVSGLAMVEIPVYAALPQYCFDNDVHCYEAASCYAVGKVRPRRKKIQISEA